MEFTSFFTPQGQQLAVKLHAGAAIVITRVVAGGGKTPATATALSDPKQTLALRPIERKKNVASLPATLVAIQAESAYSLTELGVYAQDPELGEILYKLYALVTPIPIVPTSQTLLRFYLGDIVTAGQPVTAPVSPAGVITETDLAPLQDKVLSTEPVTRTYTMDISQVPAFLNALPRLLTDRIILNVSGTLAAPLIINDFYGSGSFRIAAPARAGCTLQDGISCTDCSVLIEIWNMAVPTPITETSPGALISNCAYVRFDGCDFHGNRKNRGLEVSEGSSVIAEGCSIAQYDIAALVAKSSTLTIASNVPADFHDNTIGAYVWYGGIILLSASVPNLLGGTANAHGSGIIVNAAGALI